MGLRTDFLAALRDAYLDLGKNTTGEDRAADFLLLSKAGHCYAGKSRMGNAVLVIPLGEPPSAAARVSFGCSLSPSDEIEFQFLGRRWRQPAAVLECTQPDLLETFVALVHDVASRLGSESPSIRWAHVVEIVAEWQHLLAPRRRLSAETELGLWAEIWFILQSEEKDRLLAAWRGPERGHIDFVLGNVGAEIKASGTRLTHHVSREQAGQPLGDLESFFVSCWVTQDPDRGRSLPMLVDELTQGVSDPSLAVKLVLAAGYSPADRLGYTRRFLVLDEAWFAAADVPQVRTADPGVSELRYKVELDEAHRLEESAGRRIQLHFGRRSIATPEQA